MLQVRIRFVAALAAVGGLCLVLGAVAAPALGEQGFLDRSGDRAHANDQLIRDNTRRLVDDGRQIFRSDTFGSETFFGDVLQLHKAIEGTKLGGIPAGDPALGGIDGVSPKTALAVGLKVDVDALPGQVQSAIKAGQVNLDDPAVTLTLLKLNAVVGLTGFFNNDGTTLRSVGIQCAFCHSTVDNSFAPGIGRRLDGWPNQDLNVGVILDLAPEGSAGSPPTGLAPVAQLLGVDIGTVRTVLKSWGPGKFDAETFMDGKAFNDAFSNTGPDPNAKTPPPKTPWPGATLIPPAFGMAGVNLHTWTGWGSVTYWNAFVANLEMHGTPGTFFDPRLDNAQKFPIAAKAGFGHLHAAPDQAAPDHDRISPQLPALHFYQLAIPAPKAPAGSFNATAAQAGKALFDGKGKCATCHVPPTFTEPGWNMHTAQEIGIDDFQASRSPDDRYRTTPLAGRLFWRTRGFYHDGRFATLTDVVNHYNSTMNLGLTNDEVGQLVEYLKSI